MPKARLRRGLLLAWGSGITLLFWSVLFCLTALAAVSSCAISADGFEHSYFLPDSPAGNLLVLAGAVLLCPALRALALRSGFAARLGEDGFFRKARRLLLALALIVSLVWVLATQSQLFADPLSVQKSAYALRVGINAPLRLGGYLAAYPHQLGLTWLLYALGAVFGDFNPLVFQILNAFGLVLLLRELSECAGLFGLGRGAQLGVLVLGLLFCPLWMYCSFTYGNLLGLAFAVTALRLELRFFRDGGPFRALLAAGAIGLAMLLKPNCLIFLLGMLLWAGAELLRRWQWKRLLLPALLIAAWLAQALVPRMLTRLAADYRETNGMSAWSWVAMGLQESSRAPGWYSGYPWSSYAEAEYDGEVQAEIARQDVQDRLEEFSRSGEEALAFFTRKTASQWNNPCFQAQWILQTRGMAVTPPTWVWRLLSPAGVQQSSVFLNALQFLILTGAMLYCCLCRRRRGYHAALSFALIFIGGFVFHLFWEAKGQYTLPYFVLLLPLAAGGWSALAGALTDLAAKRRAPRGSFAALLPFLLLGAALTASLCLLYHGKTEAMLQSDEAEYAAYLEKADRTPGITAGRWTLEAPEGGGLRGMEDGSAALYPTPAVLQIQVYQDKTWLFLDGTTLCLTAEKQPWFRSLSYAVNQNWQIRAVEGGVRVLYLDYALTRDAATGALCLEAEREGPDQLWLVRPSPSPARGSVQERERQ